MSSFIVSADTMQRCVSAMAGVNCKQSEGTELGRELFRMNSFGSGDLTPDEVEWDWVLDFGGQRTAHRRLPVNLATACDWLKALECLAYQCTPGARETDLFTRVTSMIKSYRAHIVEQLPEYKSAPWDSEV